MHKEPTIGCKKSGTSRFSNADAERTCAPPASQQWPLSSQVGIAPIAGAFIIVAAAVLIAGPARAHDWYEGVTNAQGERCCGGKKCERLENGDVKEIPGGVLIQSMDELAHIQS